MDKVNIYVFLGIYVLYAIYVFLSLIPFPLLKAFMSFISFISLNKLSEAEFKEFEPQLNYGWFLVKLYLMFQDLRLNNDQKKFPDLQIFSKILKFLRGFENLT